VRTWRDNPKGIPATITARQEQAHMDGCPRQSRDSTEEDKQLKKTGTVDDSAVASTQETGKAYRLTCLFTQYSVLFEMEYASVDTLAATRHPQAVPAPSDELKNFLTDPWTALFNSGFVPERTLREQDCYALPVRYLISLSREFSKTLRARLAELEFLREKIDLPCPESFLLEAQATRPYALGQEFLDDAWFIRYWERLCSIFRQDIIGSRCSAEDYLKHKNPDEVMYGWVYFYLVENREQKDEAPFAFMATFAMVTPDGKRVQQMPLQKAVELYRDALPSMVKLLSQVSRAAKQSAFIDGLMRSGDLFHAIRLTADEAYTILKEIPVYEQCGIYCRIPDWWHRQQDAIGAWAVSAA